MMRPGVILSIFIISGCLLRAQPVPGWEKTSSASFDVYFTAADKNYVGEYEIMLKAGCDSVQSFFHKSFNHFFEVFIYANRNMLDSAWQKDWKSPGLKSECWMVASGVAKKIDILSPIRWDDQSCEHSFKDKKAVAQLITHELFHVYHGQFNTSPDFNDTENIDWFVEGLATYASGQLTDTRKKEVKEAIQRKEIPIGLDQFWTGKIRYGLSGSVIAYIDHTYGRSALQKLLVFNKKSSVLASLGITESQLIDGWEKYMLSQ